MGDDNYKFKKGDKVKVWSLQSFHYGGFLNGKDAVVFQDQNDGGSVLVSVERKMMHKEDEIDPTYEVYPEQLKLIESSPPNPTHEERMTKWWYVGDETTHKSKHYWDKVSGYSMDERWPYFIAGTAVTKDWFNDKKSANIPPEDK